MAPRCSERLRIHDWDVAIQLDWDAIERSFVGSATLYRDDAIKCRIGLNRDFESADEAARFLRRCTEEFIEDWRQRPHTADSEFSEL